MTYFIRKGHRSIAFSPILFFEFSNINQTRWARSTAQTWQSQGNRVCPGDVLALCLWICSFLFWFYYYYLTEYLSGSGSLSCFLLVLCLYFLVFTSRVSRFTFPCLALPFCLLSQLCSHACSPPIPTCLSLCLHGYCTSCFILTVSPVFSVLAFASLCLSCLISSLCVPSCFPCSCYPVWI